MKFTERNKLKMNKFKFFSAITAILFTTYFFCSCNQNSPVTSASSPGTSVSMMSSTTHPQVINGLTVNNAKFLIEFIKLERARGRDDGDVKVGPFVVGINLLGTVTLIALNTVPPGTYNEVHFKIHKYTPGETVIDPDFGTTGP